MVAGRFDQLAYALLLRGVVDQALHQRAVELDEVQGHGVDQLEWISADAEVFQRKAHATIAQFVGQLRDLRQMSGGDIFRYLYAQALRRHVAVAQLAVQPHQQRRVQGAVE